MTERRPDDQAILAPCRGGDEIDRLAVTTVRMLAVDAVEAAQSGHPGLPLGCAVPAWALWSRFLRHDPSCPEWPDRDRFVLSAGHGSALLYALLHLFGYDLGLEELRRFRQLGSRTPGHPEHGLTPGVETTTGPLGQGIGNAVGMALAERMLAARYNRPDAPPIVDHRTFVLASDGDLMEGISHEVASLAGHLGLGRLVVLYDDNRITIDGSTELATSDDVVLRFTAYRWSVEVVDDGNDLDAVVAAIERACADESQPHLVVVRTHIGYGAPTKQDTAEAHGAPLGAAEVAGLRQRFAWPETPFWIPPQVAAAARDLARRGTEMRRAWEERFATWAARHPDLAGEWQRTQAGELPDDLEPLRVDLPEAGSMATRVASGRVLGALATSLPELVGGSADLAGSTNVSLPGSVTVGDYAGRQIHFGVREHGMGAILNGIALHRGLRPFGSTFLVFSDYMRPAIRLAALMELPVVYVFTHDSIGLGEDGPTHQPVEHLLALRAIPNLAVLRPADAHETVVCWQIALHRREGPTALALSRQALPILGREGLVDIPVLGARVVRDAQGSLDVVLVATGSEVATALAAADVLAAEGLGVRVVSMPWRERFLACDPRERESLLPPDAPVVAVEAGVTLGWQAIVGETGAVVGLDRFGASGPGAQVMAALGFTQERIAAAARECLARARERLPAASAVD